MELGVCWEKKKSRVEDLVGREENRREVSGTQTLVQTD